ncbi:SDR family oxidoreductase [Tundrisphaera lichenicola]|uniref:SDR family oxidoreductase n=1 Tax=Tundrisphaera lichenicola TaxID=2029860 RepID=UPI003EBA652B
MALRAIVVGGSGQIGGWLLRTLVDRGHEAVGTYATVAYPGLHHLDASDLAASAAWLRAQTPDVVFYPAGFTWVDGCERDPAKARSANVEQPLNLARVAADLGARFVYFSTDYVFGLHGGPYTEDSPTDALSAYGKSKLEAEHALAGALGDRQLTVRTSWVFGPERQGKNFSYQLAKALSSGKTLECPTDQISSPSYGPDVARAVVGLVEGGHSGLIHVAGPETIDRVRFAKELARGFGLDTSLIVGKSTAELGQGAPRPLSGGLLTPRLDSLIAGAMRPMADCMVDYLTQLESTEGLAQPLPPGDLLADAMPLEPRIL